MVDKTNLERILILDDDADFRKLLITYLGKMLADVELIEYDPVANGAPGEDFDWSRYDVLILDYYLTRDRLTGLDILQMNRKNQFFPAVVMLTGAGNEEIAVRALKSGVYDYLRKEELNKEQLKDSIVEAWVKLKTERERLNELTSQSHAFNKALFYQQLEKVENSGNTARVLLLIELDKHEQLENKFGIIIRDNIIRHLARRSFDALRLKKSNPSITRFSDVSIALLIDEPIPQSTLESCLEELCSVLRDHPYLIEEIEYAYTISIGAMALSRQHASAEEVIQQIRIALATANKRTGNTFSIYSDAKRATSNETDTSAKEIHAQAKSNNAETEKTDLKSALSKIKNAFEEKRVIQTFQPVISLLTTEDDSIQNIYRVSLQMLDSDGSVTHLQDIQTALNTDDIQKYIDRWMLRETIGRIVNSNTVQHIFLLKLSAASLADATFFNWLRKLLSGIDKRNPGRYIFMEISEIDFLSCQKQAAALIKYLNESHDFRFMLGFVNNIDKIEQLTAELYFDLVKINYGSMKQLQETVSNAEGGGYVLQKLRSNGTYVIADNISDATALTDAISAGADYAMGEFIGEKMTQLEDITNVESFEII
ncbi:MAG: EAL domain-containing protein [Gammaproteobacteria bacterium]|nr:EAL domain-containing protein [Gammaproteobacteria bacterium]